MSRRIGVALCAAFDLPAIYADAFAAEGLDLRAPDELASPEQASFALTFKPEPDAFAPYPNLGAVIGIGAGVEAILACPSRPADAPLIRQTDADQADQMAGFALWHILHWHRRFDLMLAAQAEGAWLTGAGGLRLAHVDGAPWPGPSPRDFPVGVLGFGFLGRRVAEAALALNYPVRTFSRTAPEPLPGAEHFHGDALADFLSEVRALVAVLPHTPATERMLDAALFAALPRGAVVINIGRGVHLDAEALTAALDSGRLAGASLDVFDEEPLPPITRSGATRAWSSRPTPPATPPRGPWRAPPAPRSTISPRGASPPGWSTPPPATDPPWPAPTATGRAARRPSHTRRARPAPPRRTGPACRRNRTPPRRW
jgi:glyoxylate/hydroxypyruvate reductase A